MEQITDQNLIFFQNELKGFVNHRVRDISLAEDIIQDVFIKVHLRQAQLKNRERMYNWIYQITQNAITDHFRKQSRILIPPDIDWDYEPINFNLCVSEYLMDFLPTLPAIYRQALELSEFENVSQTEIASRLRISYSGAKSRVQRAKILLREKVDKVLIVKTDHYGNAIFCQDRKPCC